MNKRSILRTLAAVVVLAASAVRALADPPDLLRSYRFLPRLSTLTESGGIAGFTTEFRVMGTFDFVTGYDNGWPGPTLTPTAGFTNVDAWAPHPILAYVLNLDQELALSTLSGELLPLGAPFDVYRFTGKTEQGAEVQLFATPIGRWMYLRGETTPPCCDFFKYELQAVARQVPSADWNADGEIDRRDLVQWASLFGSGPAATVGAADGGSMDGADFLEWQRQSTEPVPNFALVDAALSAALAASVGAVPEPASILLAAIVAAGVVACSRAS